MENHSQDSTRQSLAAIEKARWKAADRLVTPWWYHPVLGLLTSAYLVAIILGNQITRFIALAIFLLGVAALVGAYRKLTGVWISGFSAGKASQWAYSLVGLLILCGVGAFLLHDAGLDWPTWVAAALAFTGVIVLGRKFDVALRDQLRATP